MLHVICALMVAYYRYIGGEINTCHNAVDRHVASGRGEQVAVIHDSPVTNSKTTLTYKQLLHEVCKFMCTMCNKSDIVTVLYTKEVHVLDH